MRESQLLDALRSVADAMDAGLPEVDPAALADRRRLGRRPSRRARRGSALVAAALVVAAIAAGAVVVRLADDDPTVRTRTSATDPPTSEAPPPPTSGDDDPDRSTAPTTVPGPVDVSVAYDGVPFAELPDGGLALVEGATVTLTDWSGTELGSFPAELLPQLGHRPAESLVVGEGTVEVRPRVSDAGDGCLGTGRAGVRVAVCGAQQEQLVTRGPAGERTPVAGRPLGAVIGRWRWAEPSPDGEWLLAQWSAECEVPFALLVRPDGTGMRTVDGLDRLDAAPTSLAVGWAPDGRAVAVLPETACGSAADEPGVYAIDPDTGEATLLRAGGQVGAAVWEHARGGDERERSLARALDELGVEACCGEPSHGSAGLSGGLVWDGVAVPIVAADDHGAVEVPALDPALTPEPLVGGPGGTSGRVGEVPFLVFACGGSSWFLGGIDVAGAVAPLEVLREAAVALIPHLGCALTDPPRVDAG